MRSSSLRTTLLVLFTLSGFSGLIYESIWSHYLKLVLGHAAYAQTLVLAIFMGGMALGAWLASRASSRWTNPLLVYALVEGLVGLSAIGFHRVFVWAQDALFVGAIPALSGGAAAGLLKWVVASGLILPQSVLLGMTFPLMSAAILRLDRGAQGSGLALAYFTNSIGAALGVLASGFLLIRWSGLPGTVLIAGLLNLAVALIVWGLARGGGLPALDANAVRAPRSRIPLAGFMLAGALFTGLASFFYEIAWIRMLSMVLGATTQAFELMLSAFITGLALGGLAIRKRIDRFASPLRAAGYVQLLMGALALLTLPAYGATFDVMGFLLGSLKQTAGGYTLFHLGSHAIALAIMLPATFMAGMTLPLFTLTLLRGGQGERAIGRIYAANTVGAILGVLLAVHVILPVVGTKGLIMLGALVDIVLGLAFLGAALERRGRAEWFAAAGVAAALLGLVLFGVRVDPVKTASGVYRHGNSALPPGSQVVFHRDGKTATIDLVRTPRGVLSLTTNGKPDAAIDATGRGYESDEMTMVLLGALPLAAHPEARTVANIGLGSGMTTHTLLGAVTVERVDTIEIERAMVEAARLFGPPVARAFDDPRSAIHVEDAKTFFASRQRVYDIIISEPSNPWVSGVASLFSEEFYEHVKRHLAEGGVLAQWLQLYEMNLDLLSSVFQALDEHFPGYAVFNTDSANIVILATRDGEPVRLDPWVFSMPGLREDLRRVDIRGPQDLSARRLGSSDLLQPLFAASTAPANSDFFPYLSQRAPRSRFLDESVSELTGLHVAAVPLIEMLDGRAPATVPLTRSPHFAPSEASDFARRLADALITRHPLTGKVLLPGFRYTLRLLELQAESCAENPPDEEMLRGAWFSLASAVNPFLDRRTLGLAWTEIERRSCPDTLAEGSRKWLALHRAVGDRDGSLMLELATVLLAESAHGRQEMDYLLSAGIVGGLAGGEVDAAADLWRRHGGKSDRLPLHLRLAVSRLPG